MSIKNFIEDRVEGL